MSYCDVLLVMSVVSMVDNCSVGGSMLENIFVTQCYGNPTGIDIVLSIKKFSFFDDVVLLMILICFCCYCQCGV